MEFFRLIGLKNIFARQLPNMPKEYIVRLVMDRYLQLQYLLLLGGERLRIEIHTSFNLEAFCLTSPFRLRDPTSVSALGCFSLLF